MFAALADWLLFAFCLARVRELPLRANSRSPLQEEYDSEWDDRSRRSACISRLALRIFPREAELAARSATGLCQGQRLACVADWLIFPPAKQHHFPPKEGSLTAQPSTPSDAIASRRRCVLERNQIWRNVVTKLAISEFSKMVKSK